MTEQHEENQYLDLIRKIIDEGSDEKGRNGNVRVHIGASMRFSLKNNKIPFLTTKKLAWKTCAKELFWFLRGDTNNVHLREQNVHIWDDNGSRDFLDSRGLQHLEVDDLGPVYGHQWRHFNAEYSNCHADYSGKGVDQIAYIVEQLKNPETRTSRRLVMSAWNPCQLNEMALPPCHVLVQFNVVKGNQLSCCLYQRSGDVGLGVPFNIASYCLLTRIIASHCGLEASEFVYFLSNAHIYDDHIESLREQITREPYPFPTIEIKSQIQDLDNITLDNFELSDYEYHSKISMKMRK
ncbi:MAG: thymidylate synthase [Vampirovibrionia bacterium]|jgi:thymidylate synthase